MKKKSSSEIIKESSEKLVKHRELHKKKITEKLDRFVYWTSLALLACFNFVACLFLIPFLVLFEGFYVYFAVATLGFIFGVLFNTLMLGLEHLKPAHTLVAGVFIPILAVGDIAIITMIADNINTMLRLPYALNVSEIIIIFIGSFITPYVIALLTGKHRL